jgi:hypothetical protein
MVEGLVAAGFEPKHIAGALELPLVQLKEHYAEELEEGLVRANGRVVKNLLDIATSDSRQAVAAIKFWLANKANWVDRSTHEHTGANGEPIQAAIVELDPKTVEAIRRRYISNTD